MNEEEYQSILSEIIEISRHHQNNARMTTLKNECLGLLEKVYKGEDTNMYQLKITTHKGKMQGIRSLSTYKMFSDTCLKLKDNPKTICNKCYVDKTMLYAPQLSLALIYNTILLKYTKLSKRQLPIINDLYFRFESFSDLQNQNHLQNLYAIAKHNPYTQFALWTKNYTLLWKEKAPKNVNLILSSPLLNECTPYADLLLKTTKARTGAKNVKMFSVYDGEHIQNQNCLKSCINCLKCYKKNDKTEYIVEHLK
jgi:hypothetical protein